MTEIGCFFLDFDTNKLTVLLIFHLTCFNKLIIFWQIHCRNFFGEKCWCCGVNWIVFGWTLFVIFWISINLVIGIVYDNQIGLWRCATLFNQMGWNVKESNWKYWHSGHWADIKYKGSFLFEFKNFRIQIK